MHALLRAKGKFHSELPFDNCTATTLSFTEIWPRNLGFVISYVAGRQLGLKFLFETPRTRNQDCLLKRFVSPAMTKEVVCH